MVFRAVLVLLLLLSSLSNAYAYAGPGAGVSLVGAIIGLIGTVFVILGAVLAWPIRKFLKARKARRGEGGGAEPAVQEEPAADDT
jgi:hypothetical protein